MKGMLRDRKAKAKPQKEITERELEDIEELSGPRSPVIYEIVRRHGEEEIARQAEPLVRHVDLHIGRCRKFSSGTAPTRQLICAVISEGGVALGRPTPCARMTAVRRC
jgi:hypothetical protein